MGQADPRIERYLARERPWRDEIAALRRVVLDEGLTETLKWRSPCYTAHGGNVCMVDALKDTAFVSFFKGVLLEDPEGTLVPPGPNSRSARYFKCGSVEELVRTEPILRGFLRQAVDNERLGRRVDLPPDDLDLPDELVAALHADPDLAAAWESLTPGRRRGYVVAIAGARKSETRSARIDKHRAAILAGRGLHDR
ncbi:YdeI/OmpD-associated family protein [Roseivivax sediminis]|nr:YdeI/OmpD-associated family protein [Roseivivax sediminis]